MSDSSLATQGLSLRDPDAVLTHHQGRLLRMIRPHAAAAFAHVLSSPSVTRLAKAGSIVATRKIDCPDYAKIDIHNSGDWYEHERIEFVSYPCEWSAAMLARAAQFTLELSIDLLADDLMLKDATPANILFRGAQPVLVDVPSIVQRPTGRFIWSARDQFERTFLLPLLANRYLHLPMAWTLQDPAQGINHAQLAAMLGTRRFLHPELLATVAIPAALGKAAGGSSGAEPTLKNDEQARFTLERTYRSLLRRVRRRATQVNSRSSHWKEYVSTRDHYSMQDLEAKREFVAAAIDSLKPQWVLDVGANTGEFSRIAASQAHVVALDTDESSVARIFQQISAGKDSILPLVANFARPTPASGWLNNESQSLLQRCNGRFDLVLMLAVIHHLRVAAGIPLAAILDAARDTTRSGLIIEHVPPSDQMFRQLARGRDLLYDDCVLDNFVVELKKRFDIAKTVSLPNGRTLFLATLPAAT